MVSCKLRADSIELNKGEEYLLHTTRGVLKFYIIVAARDPLLLDLLGTVKTRLDQLEEEEEDLGQEHVLNEESDDSEDMTDSSEEEEDVSEADDEDDSSQDIDDVSENDESLTETSDSGVCLSEYENR